MTSVVVVTRAEAGQTESTLVGRGQGSGAGATQEITVGSGLAMTGTTLSATGGGGPASQLDANGTTLDVDAIADGEYLRRVGTTVVGGSPSGSASATTIERDLGATGAWTGTFTITDAAITGTSKVIVTQAPGPYTGKGTRADEAEMDTVTCIAYPASGSATVRWRVQSDAPSLVPLLMEGNSARAPGATNALTPYQDAARYKAVVRGRIKGNVKFTYQVFS